MSARTVTVVSNNRYRASFPGGCVELVLEDVRLDLLNARDQAFLRELLAPFGPASRPSEEPHQ